MKNSVFYRVNLTANVNASLMPTVDEQSRVFGVQDTQYVRKLKDTRSAWEPVLYTTFCVALNRMFDQHCGTDSENTVCVQLGVDTSIQPDSDVYLYLSCQTTDIAIEWLDRIRACWSTTITNFLERFWNENLSLTEERRLPLINFHSSLTAKKVDFSFDPLATLRGIKSVDYLLLLEGDKLQSNILGIQESMNQIRSVARESVSEAGRMGTAYRHLNSAIADLKVQLGQYSSELATDFVAAYLLPVIMHQRGLIPDVKCANEFYAFFQKGTLSSACISTMLKRISYSQPDLLMREFHDKNLQQLGVGIQPSSQVDQSVSTDEPEASFFVEGYSGPNMWF